MTTKEKIELETLKLKELLIAKNSDYGDSALKAPPLVPGADKSTAILIRLGDKFERLQALTKSEARVDESFEDTIRDLAGYCVMYLVSRAADSPEAAVEEETAAIQSASSEAVNAADKSSDKTPAKSNKAAGSSTFSRVGRYSTRGKR